jgi:predicted enzyme related to lactoylglutathione lyase
MPAKRWAKDRRKSQMGQKIVHVEVIGKDGKKLQDFYSELFDWAVDTNNPMNYGTFSADDAGVGGGIAGAQPGEPSRVTFYVEVEDLDEYLRKAEALGGKAIIEPSDVPGGPRLAMFTDPEGNIVGLIQAGRMG